MSRSITRTMLLSAVAVVTVACSNSQAQAQNWFNPEIYNSGRQVTGAQYDPFTGKIIVRTDRTKVRESYLDPNRNNMDPGSFRNVNRYETDLNGVRWHVTGTQWTSGGVRHGNLSRRRLGGNNGGPVVEDRNEHVAFGVKSDGQSSNKTGNTNRGPGNTKQFQSGNRSGITNRGPGNTGQYRSSKPALRNYSPF